MQDSIEIYKLTVFRNNIGWDKFFFKTREEAELYRRKADYPAAESVVKPVIATFNNGQWTTYENEIALGTYVGCNHSIFNNYNKFNMNRELKLVFDAQTHVIVPITLVTETIEHINKPIRNDISGQTVKTYSEKPVYGLAGPNERPLFYLHVAGRNSNGSKDAYLVKPSEVLSALTPVFVDPNAERRMNEIDVAMKAMAEEKKGLLEDNARQVEQCSQYGYPQFMTRRV